jgi:hypothetical protein
MMMANFLVLYRSPTSAEEQMANADPAQAQAGMDAWMAWAKEAADAVVDLGTPLGAGRHVGAAGTTGATADVAGYSILTGASLDAITQLMQHHPHLHGPGNTIDVLPMLAMPGNP